MLKKITLFCLSLALMFCLVPSLTQAQALGNFKNALGGANQAATISGVDTKSSVESYVQSLTTIALSLIGVIFFILMLYGGFKWMMAKGEAKEVDKAKDIITMGVIGLVVIILAYAISSFVIKAIVSISTKATP